MYFVYSGTSESAFDFTHNVSKNRDRTNSYAQFRRQIYACPKTAWVETSEIKIVSHEFKVVPFFSFEDIF